VTMAEVVQHPNAPTAEPMPDGTAVDDVNAPSLHDDPDEPIVAYETRKMIRMLIDEIGWDWMSTPLRLQIEEVQILMGDRGTNA
jgi:hypothetical protein